MKTSGESATEMKRKIQRLRDELNCLRMEKELLDWEKSHAEATSKYVRVVNSERSQSPQNQEVAPARERTSYIHADNEEDSEVRFKTPQMPAHRQDETSGYMTQEQALPLQLGGRYTYTSTSKKQEPWRILAPSQVLHRPKRVMGDGVIYIHLHLHVHLHSKSDDSDR